MPAGRPLEYSDEVLKDAWAYVQEFATDTVEVKGEVVMLNVQLPTIEGLALYLEISRSTLYLWRDKYPAFSDIIETLQQKQVQTLINNGLSGRYNSTIAKVLLGKQGYHDKQEIEQKTEITGSLQFNGIEVVKPDAPSQEV